jgi:nucleotide-binding universal stress UspA family protein
MYSRIVVAYTVTGEGRDALALAGQLAAADDARIVVAHAIASPRATTRKARGALADVRTRVALGREAIHEVLGPDAPAVYRPLVDRPYPSTVHTLARRLDAGLIVAGQSRLGPIARALVGGGVSIEPLVAGAPCPVAIAPAGQQFRSDLPLARIAVPCDGSVEAERALPFATALAEDVGCPLRLVAFDRAERDAAEAVADQLDTTAPVEVVALHGDPTRNLLGQHGEGADALVIGCPHPATSDGVPGGAMWSRVLRHATCPVWAIGPSAVAPVRAHDRMTAA